MARTIDQQIAEAQAKLARLKTRQKASDTRRKIIVGAIVTTEALKDPKIARWLASTLRKNATRDVDQKEIAGLLADPMPGRKAPGRVRHERRQRPFEILADEITLIRRQVDHLQRTSLDKDEAEAFNVRVAEVLNALAEVAPRCRRSCSAIWHKPPSMCAGMPWRPRRGPPERQSRNPMPRASRPRKTSHGPQERHAERLGAGSAGSGSG